MEVTRPSNQPAKLGPSRPPRCHAHRAHTIHLVSPPATISSQLCHCPLHHRKNSAGRPVIPSPTRPDSRPACVCLILVHCPTSATHPCSRINYTPGAGTTYYDPLHNEMRELSSITKSMGILSNGGAVFAAQDHCRWLNWVKPEPGKNSTTTGGETRPGLPSPPFSSSPYPSPRLPSSRILPPKHLPTLTPT